MNTDVASKSAIFAFLSETNIRVQLFKSIVLPCMLIVARTTTQTQSKTMDAKTYVFGENGNNANILSTLVPLLQNKGIDPSVLALMNNNGWNNGGEWIWIIFLLAIWGGWGGNGFGGFGCGNRCNGTDFLSSQINNSNGRELLMNAIQGNRDALGQLSNALQVSNTAVQNGFSQVMQSLCNIGNTVGLTGQQVINSIQAGNMQLAQQIAQCCCDNRLETCQQTNTLQNAINGVATGQERGFSSIAYETQRQTCDIRDAIRENTSQVLAGQRSAEMREVQREIAERDRKIAEQAVIINNGQQTAMFGQMISQATQPIAAAVAGLKSDVDCIKCKLPETATIPYSPVVGIPACAAYNYGFFGNYGLNPNNGWA